MRFLFDKVFRFNIEWPAERDLEQSSRHRRLEHSYTLCSRHAAREALARFRFAVEQSQPSSLEFVSSDWREIADYEHEGFRKLRGQRRLSVYGCNGQVGALDRREAPVQDRINLVAPPGLS
jgi:hypothetical protein